MATLDELELRLRALEQAQAAEPISYYTSIFSGEEMDQRLAAAGVLGAASTPQAALANLGAAVRPNLLDNAYFVGGGTGYGVFPVNQRGRNSYSNQQSVLIGIDRWHLDWGSSVSLEQDGLAITGGIFQYLPKSIEALLPNRVVTVSALRSDGKLATKTGLWTGENLIADGVWLSPNYAASGNVAVRLLNIKVAAVKLELGDAQTLAHQKPDGTWAMLPQNLDYRQELAKCQAYQIELNPYKFQNPTVGTVTRGPGNWYCAIALPATMRTIPTLKIDRGTPTVECPDGTFPVSQLTLLSATSGMAFFVLTFSGSTPSAASPGILYIAGTDSGADAPSVLLDANL